MSSLVQTSQTFIEYLDQWMHSLPEISLEQVVAEPAKIALISVDLINGFCNEGTLSSPRVKEIVNPAVRLMNAVWKSGVRQILLAQDTHDPDAEEFNAYAPHCIRGTREAEAVDEIKSLPFYSQITTIEKNSIHSVLNTELAAWLKMHKDLTTFMIVGDCTDLCVYQLAMHLRLEANTLNIHRRVIIPADCVQTYDLPVGLARQVNATPHDGNLLHALFLYHMTLNGIEIVRSIESE